MDPFILLYFIVAAPGPDGQAKKPFRAAAYVIFLKEIYEGFQWDTPTIA